MRRLAWEGFDRAADLLAPIVMALGASALLPVPRGGLVLAVALSHRTGLPVLGRRDPPPPGTVLVEDIVDTGRALAEAREGLLRPAMFCAAWMLREGCPARNVLAAECAAPGEWIVFPWERQDDAAATADQEAYRAAR